MAGVREWNWGCDDARKRGHSLAGGADSAAGTLSEERACIGGLTETGKGDASIDDRRYVESATLNCGSFSGVHEPQYETPLSLVVSTRVPMLVQLYEAPILSQFGICCLDLIEAFTQFGRCPRLFLVYHEVEESKRMLRT